MAGGLKLYNTLTRDKVDFEPIDPDNVRLYVCGPTVYDFAHIGNARPVIVFDVLYRLLRHTYGADKVTYVRNITDVDDKINARALRDFGLLAPEAEPALRWIGKLAMADVFGRQSGLGRAPDMVILGAGVEQRAIKIKANDLVGKVCHGSLHRLKKVEDASGSWQGLLRSALGNAENVRSWASRRWQQSFWQRARAPG